MLHTQTVEPLTLELLRSLVQKEYLSQFVLVGGTAPSLNDIVAMKLNAITGRGKKKDFFDLYFLLKHFTMKELLNLYMEKYPHQTTFHVVRSLVYFVDAEEDPDPFVFDDKTTWSEVKSSIEKEIRKIEAEYL